MDYNQNPPVKFFVLPGGHAPERKSEGAVGYDAYARTVVSPKYMQKGNLLLRKSLFDFSGIPVLSDTADAEELEEEVDALEHVVRNKDENKDEWAYRLNPGESVLVGTGFVTAMPPGLCYSVDPRSGLASKERITVTNAPGIVDSDYRGEAGVLLLNIGKKPFYLKHHMRIAQLIFFWGIFPIFEEVLQMGALGETERGAGGFGSTGLTDKPK